MSWKVTNIDIWDRNWRELGSAIAQGDKIKMKNAWRSLKIIGDEMFVKGNMKQ